MKKILVGTGGSPWSDAAVMYAARQAMEGDGRLIILHVVDTAQPSFPVHERKREDAREILERARRLAARFVDAIEVRCMKGSPADILVETADTEKCDLIVLGSRGRSRFKDRLLGSTIARVIAYTHRPVAVVKESAELEGILKVGRERMVFPESPDPHAHLASPSAEIPQGGDAGPGPDRASD